MRSIIAFCNTHGGELIIGINDDGSVKGVPQKDIIKVTGDIERDLLHTVKPVIRPKNTNKNLK